MLFVEKLFLWFLFYSFCGWVYESILVSILERRPVNRGFLNGPLCPIYGVGAVGAVVVLGQVHNPLVVFLLSMVGASILEYVTSWVMEALFHARWWDYSDYKFNLNGRICLLGAFVFGVGGVGGYTVEALARSGVGALALIDDDKVCLTNLNRQIIATRKTVGRFKVDVAEERVHDIDPNIKVTTYKTFFGPETQDSFDFSQFDYVVDAIDTVTGKIALVMKCKEAGVPIICSMGAGNKMDPTRFEVTDIYKTSVCPLAKVMRTECRKRRIRHLKVVYSREPVMTPIEDDSISCKYHCICPPGTQRKCTIRRSVPGSNAFVPSVVASSSAARS